MLQLCYINYYKIRISIEAGFDFIIANKECEPAFDPNSWYRPWKRKPLEYNSCLYQSTGWAVPCRFVVMRIPKELAKKPGQAIQPDFNLAIFWVVKGNHFPPVQHANYFREIIIRHLDLEGFACR